MKEFDAFLLLCRCISFEDDEIKEASRLKKELITGNADWKKIKLDAGKKPEVIFVLANHNPRSSKLHTILSDPEIEAYDSSPNFDLRFYVASFAGYALHADCMVSLAQFCELLRNKNAEPGAALDGDSAVLHPRQ
jgi:hypothetical protein